MNLLKTEEALKTKKKAIEDDLPYADETEKEELQKALLTTEDQLSNVEKVKTLERSKEIEEVIYQRRAKTDESKTRDVQDLSTFHCSLCAKNNKNVAAAKYCEECDENFCRACLTLHNESEAMKGHQISDNLKNIGLCQGTHSVTNDKKAESVGKPDANPTRCIFVQQINGRVRANEKVCHFTDLCLTYRGELVLADYNNKCLKKIDTKTDFKNVGRFDMFDSPFGICTADNERFAVTLINRSKVQFVSQQTMELEESFSVNGKCRGIDCHNGLLYVCCEAFTEETCDHIEVRDLTGALLKDYYGELKSPTHARVSGDFLLISNSDSLVTCDVHDFNSDIKPLSVKHVLILPEGICGFGPGKWCVAECDKILLIQMEGGQHQELLTKKMESCRLLLFVLKESKACCL